MHILVAEAKSFYRKEQQDVHLVVKNLRVEGDVLAIVCDGHGEKYGRFIAQTVANEVAKGIKEVQNPFIESEVRFLIGEIAARIRRLPESYGAGATLAFLYRAGKQLLVGNVGDSTVEAVFSHGIYVLTEDHSNKNSAECARMKQNGWLMNGHGYFVSETEDVGGIAVSRAFGDSQFKAMKAIPFLTTYNVTEEPCYFLVATDGVEDTVIRGRVPLYYLLKSECEHGADVFKIALEASALENVAAILVFDFAKSLFST